MRTAKEDVALIGAAGVWNDERDWLMNAVVLLLMYGKGRHKPVRNLHNLASALERRDSKAVEKYYDRLAQEVAITLKKYPDIVGTIEMMSGLTDEDIARADRVIQQYDESVEPG